MMILLVDLLIVAGILYCAWLGSDKGLFLSLAAGLQVFVALAVAILLHESLADVTESAVTEAAGAMLPRGFELQKWFPWIFFCGLYWGTLAACWVWIQPILTDADVDTLPLVDTVAGAVAGGVAGILFLGGVLITASITPFVPFKRPTIDVGMTALRVAGRFTGEYADGRSLVLYGEPAMRGGLPLRAADADALLTSETWFDYDESGGERSEDDPFFDANRDGLYTSDLFYLDIDRNNRRRVGLLEKYAVGRWDDLAKSNNRPRQKNTEKKAPSPETLKENPPANQVKKPQPSTNAPLVKPPNEKDALPLPSTLFDLESPAPKKESPVSDF